MTKDEKALPQLLRQMVEDIKDLKCSYWLKANDFDVQRGDPPSPTEHRITRWWQAPLYIDYDRTGVPALWNPQFEKDAMQMDVILKNTLPAEHEQIRIEYAQIWSVERYHQDDTPKPAEKWMLFHDSAKLKMPPVNTE